MQSLRKLRPTLRKKKKAVEMYVYTPLVGKNGYVMEYRHPQYTMTFHYKYKENSDGTMTKIGHTLSLSADNEKDYVFYQTVADKEQIALEHKWMSQLRTAGNICLTADIKNDWVDVMQHNNKLPITDNIQRRRLREVLGNLAYQRGDIWKDTAQVADASPPTSYSYSNNSLLNVNVPQRNSKAVKNENKPTKQVHLEHPTFSKTAPVVHVYDPEESLVYKECQCEYCRYAEYDDV